MVPQQLVVVFQESPVLVVIAVMVLDYTVY